MRVLLDTTQLNILSDGRGIGIYTKLLQQHLQLVEGVDLSLHDDGQPYDLVHYPYFDLFFHTLPIRKHSKTIVTIHDVIPLVFPKAYKAGIKGTIRFFQQQVSLFSVAAVITDSERSKQDIVGHLGVPEVKVNTIYLAGNPEVRKQSPDIRERVRLQRNLPGKFALYVGDINYNKNLPRLVEACSMLPSDVHLVLVGRTVNNIEILEGQALHTAIENFGMKQRIHLLTDVEKADELSAIFGLASVYVQPSLYEGFGLSILDAMQCETPVVCANTSSLPEVGGNAAFYVDPYHCKQMAQVIAKVISLNSADRKAQRAKMQVNLSKFSWEKTAEQTVAVYKKVLGV
ncbi:MAG: glycosyltransferase family 1 protein [Patescibacteria group bacterium]